MPTRSGKGVASTVDDGAPSVQDEQVDVRDYLADMEKRILHNLTSLVMKPERMRNAHYRGRCA